MTQELRRLAEAATQGEWKAKLEQGPYPNWYLIYSEKVEPPLIVQVLRGSSWAGLASHADYFTEKTPRDIAAHANAAYIAAANPAVILSLLDRLEKAEKDAARWRYAVEIGGNQTMNWLDVYDDWDGDGEFTAQIDSAMEASK